MTREEEIRQASQKYSVATDSGSVDDPKKRSYDFIAGATWADANPKFPWHSVTNGDLPKEPKGDCVIPPFLVALRNGDIYPAYYEEDAMGNLVFYDVTESIINVDYWMEIPQLPK